jgi:glycosyltransferase involved in cell wall biosynthesis
MTGERPLISCVTITSDRVRLLKQAIACYLAQTWEPRELVVVAGGSPRYQDAIARHLAHLGRADVRLVRADAGLTLGEMRNLSLDAARGELVCQWDDDDLYHPERIRLQHQALGRDADACFLTDTLQFFDDARELYWLDWSRFAVGGPEVTMLPGSMLVRRDPRLRYPATDRGEDNDVRRQVFQLMRPVGLDGHGFLYVYRFHGRNLWPRGHHSSLGSVALEAAALGPRAPTLRRALAAFPLPRPFAVVGREGQTVFTYDGPRRDDAAAAVTPALERPEW